MALYDPYNPRFKSLPFAYNCPNYLLQIKDDTKFLLDCPISSQFAFSVKSDPFLKQCAGNTSLKVKQE